MTKVITGVFSHRREAQQALDRLVDAGFGRTEISVLVSDLARDGELPARVECRVERANRAAEGASAGGTIGGTVGAILAGLAAVGSIAIPGVGLIAAGPIVAAFTGAGVGGAAGTLIGALVGLGLSEAEAEDAKHSRARGGCIVVAVETSSERAPRAIAVLRGEGGLEVASH